jgi:ferritin-like metal-binding protein YciE
MRQEGPNRDTEVSRGMHSIAAADMGIDQTTDRSTGYRETGRARPDRMLPERGTRRGGGIGERVSEMLDIRSFDDLNRQVREHPLATLALVAGAGLLLRRSGVIEFVSDAMRDAEPDSLSPAERRLLAWLNDAYALEKAQIPILENHADDARRRPAVRRKDLEHLERTRQHVKMVKRCIEELGARPSKTKAAVGRIAGALGSVTTEPFEDEIVRNFLADYSAENLEIASYRAIIAAAREAGHPRIARICQDILKDEEEMADWLYDNLPREVRETFSELYGGR